MPRITCCMPGCPRTAAEHRIDHPDHAMCAEHWVLTSDASRRSLQLSRSRVDRLERSWHDNRTFREIVGRGRYLQLCALLEMAHERVDRAWEHIKAEVTSASAGPDALQTSGKTRSSMETGTDCATPVEVAILPVNEDFLRAWRASTPQAASSDGPRSLRRH
jgi:hypothetical protein